MHELPFAKSIYQSVMQAARDNKVVRVRKVVLEVGVLRDFVPELVQKYWDYVTRGDIAEGSRIEMVEVPATARCEDCGQTYGFGLRDLPALRCPHCGHPRGTLLTGRELRVREIEIED